MFAKTYFSKMMPWKPLVFQNQAQLEEHFTKHDCYFLFFSELWLPKVFINPIKNFPSSPCYLLSSCWSFNFISAQTAFQWLEIGSQVGLTIDPFQLLLIQHWEDLKTMRGGPAWVIAKVRYRSTERRIHRKEKARPFANKKIMHSCSSS